MADEPVYPVRPARRRFLAGLLAAALPSLPACRATGVCVAKPAPGFDEFVVDRVRNVAYHEGPDATHYHRLDAYVPRHAAGAPAVLLVHGGAWMLGDKYCWGLYASIGEFLARQGFLTAVPNYRLSPPVKHPAHVTDVSRALAWLCREAPRLGGSPDRIFLVGHSAGGHLACLLATHPCFREQAAVLRGVVSVSGVYEIPCRPVAYRLGGSSADSFRLSQVVPVRAACTRPAWLRSPLPGLPVRFDPYAPAFGDDPAVRRDASPIAHVRPGLPPFFLANAENDLPTLPEMAEAFEAALRRCGVECERVSAAGRNHSSAFFRANDVRDPLAGAMVDFLRRHAG